MGLCEKDGGEMKSEKVLRSVDEVESDLRTSEVNWKESSFTAM